MSEEVLENKTGNWILRLLAFAIMLFLPIYIVWFCQTPIWNVCKVFFKGFPITLFFFIPAFLCPRISKWWAILVYVVCLPALIFSGMHVYYFNTTISEQSLFAIFESNMAESQEFLESQVTVGALLCLLFLIAVPAYFLVRFCKTKPKTTKASIALGVIVLVGAIWLLNSNRAYKHLNENTFTNLFYSYKNYKIKIVEIKEYMARMKDAKAPSLQVADDKPLTLMVVIGESSGRSHWGLYNYFRNTTPKLNAIKDELMVFKDAISAWARTTSVVSDIITCKDIKNCGDVPLMNIFKQAGFDVFWVSLQSTVDEDNAIVCLAAGADRCVYLNRGGEQGYSHVHDGKALTTINEILNKEPKNNKRVIFVHTMGSHVNYASRFPGEFAVFNNEAELADKPWFNKKSKKYINDYDNSILYTDHVLCEYIDCIRKEPGSAFVFFSDHGEECFDSCGQHGHHDSLESPYYYEIPFFIWLSEDYKSRLDKETLERWKTAMEIPFVNRGAYTVLQLSGITVDTDNNKLSPLSQDFVPGPRIVHEKDFDAYFKIMK